MRSRGVKFQDVTHISVHHGAVRSALLNVHSEPRLERTFFDKLQRICRARDFYQYLINLRETVLITVSTPVRQYGEYAEGTVR